jgi:hypothetical protein
MVPIRMLGPLLALLLTVAMVGCHATPRERYAQVQDTFITAVEVALAARAAGEISEEDWANTVHPLIVLGSDLLDEYDARTAAGEPAELVAAEVRHVMAQLAPFLERWLE